MEALGFLRFWKNAGVGTGADVGLCADDVHNPSFSSDGEETDDNDSFFDLVIKSPDRAAAETRGGDSKDYSSSKPQSPVSILRSGPKFKVFMLGFRKSPCREKTSKPSAANQLSRSSKLDRIAAKNGAEGTPADGGPIFARDSSLRTKMLKDGCEYGASPDVPAAVEKSAPKYMKLMKPFYVRASRNARSSDSSTPSSSPAANLSSRKFCEVRRVGSFKIMSRSLVKSRSASATDGPALPPMRRRDDSLLEQSDGIQGAILHCKNSFNNPSYREISQLPRAASDNSYEKLRRNTFEEQKRCSI
ncbi:UDP-glucose:glycoprotein glucosyltransferase 1 [Striga asiatica]|uniref:UDP-glucose:glycoprotein glucosyltransferase 1 n=1 Tax=Striga asiatica TaxID=4170 RepID=A0A5A7QMR5_STRAF|nr:UDP-glucose:glycoprotein glucosyltransferase 1 [Striga asiatica]